MSYGMRDFAYTVANLMTVKLTGFVFVVNAIKRKIKIF